MFWALKLRDEIVKRFSSEIRNGTSLVIRDEKTMSGRVHIGSLRGVVIHGLVSEVLGDAGVANTYLFEINDFDVMDALPTYVDQKRYAPFLGRLLCDVPSPEEGAPNYAEFWAAEFMKVIERVGFYPSYYRSSELYRGGKYNEFLRQALDNAERIRMIYREVSGSVKDDTWFPAQVVCERCGKLGTTKVIAWNGATVKYSCRTDLVQWAAGCGHEGEAEPWNGAAKLPWKVEWAAKFKLLGVHIEGGGKDHYTKGGSRDIARRILREIFKYPEPVDIPYNFFVVGGKKMSSSKGRGSNAQEIAALLPPHLVRFLMMKDPKREIDFEPYGDTLPILYDHYDDIARNFFAKRSDDDWISVFPHIHLPESQKKISDIFLPRFSQIAYLTQMPHIDIFEQVSGMKGGALSDRERAEVDERVRYARHWLELYSPEKYRFQIQETVPDAIHSFSRNQKNALAKIREYMESHPDATGEELHSRIHMIKSELAILPADLFSAIYIAFLGKDSGPQAGWFLTALDRSFVLRRLQEAQP